MNTAEIINSMKEHVAAAYTAVTGKNGTIPEQKNLSNLAAAIDSIQLSSVNKLTQYASGELTEVTAEDLRNVSTISPYTFVLCNKLTNVTIPDSVTTIGVYAFMQCPELSSITISKNVTSIGEYAFYGCPKLTTVYYTGNVEGWCKISGLENLMSNVTTLYINGQRVEGDLVIPNSITNISASTFRNCTGLTSVIIPDSVTSIDDYAFYGCTGLTNVTIGNSVTSIGSQAFQDCSSLTSITIPDNVTSIDYSAFSGCTGLTNITGSAANISTIIGQANPTSFAIEIISGTSIDHSAFNGRNGLTNVIIGNSVTSIGQNAFYNCSNLTNITIGDNVTSIGNSAFENCGKLTSITIPNGTTSINDSVFRNTGLTSVVIPDSVTSINQYAFRDCANLTNITIGNSVTNIGNYAFYNCKNLTNITIPDAVTSISQYAFYNCTGLMSAIIGNNVESIGNYAFNSCTSLTNVTIGNNVTSIGDYAFDGCNGLTNIIIPDSVISIGQYTFRNCKNLTNVTIGNSVTNIGNYAFDNCSSLTSIIIPDNVTSIGQYAFSECIGLISATIGNGVTNIGDRAFNSCTKLTTVTIGNSVTTIGNYAFCSSALRNIVIPDNVTKINQCAFRDCTSLTSATIGNKVTTIDYEAFYNCVKLVEIYNKSPLGIIAGSRDNGYVAYYARNVYTTEDGSKLSIDENGYVIYTDGNEKILVDYRGTDTELTLPSDITQINQRAFIYNDNLVSIVIGNNVKSIGEKAFYGCRKLIEVYNKSSLNITKGSENNGYVAYYARNVYTTEDGSKLSTDENGYVIYTDGDEKILVDYTGTETELTLPIDITQINHCAFLNHTNLTSITFGNSVKNIDYSILNHKLTTVYYTGNITEWCGINGLENLMPNVTTLYIDNQKIEGDLVIPDNATSINKYAFYNRNDLTSVVIPDNVTDIGDNVFSNCTSLANVTIGNGVTNIGENAFNRCTSLANVTIGNSVTNIGRYAFYQCLRLTNITIPDSVTSIGQSTFHYCANLTSVTIGNGVTNIDEYVFGDCTNLTNIIIPNNVISIDIHAFDNCTNLTSVTIGNGLTNISGFAFSSCYKLTTVYYTGDIKGWCEISGLDSLMSNVTTLYINGKKVEGDLTIPNGVTNISDCAFRNTGLTNVIVPNGVTNIGGSAFSCRSLISITIPNSVTNIGSGAFYACNELTVFYTGTEEQWKAISIGSDNNPLINATKIYNYDGIERVYSFVTNYDQNIDSITTTYLASLPTLVRDGYHFCGWYDNETFEGDEISVPYCSKDKTTLYAKWLTEEEWSTLGTTFEKAFIAKSGRTYDVNITRHGQRVYFAFTPTINGSYTIQSIGSIDTYGTLYDSNKSSLKQDDDGAGGGNFKLTYNMTANTKYYVAAKLYSSSNTGTFRISFS